MDYKSEQLSEKESLSLLYECTNEYICVNDNSFKIFIKNKIKKISFYILFEYTEKYPEEPPLYKIVDSKNLTTTLRENVKLRIHETIENNLGYSMIYNIVENAYLSEEVDEKSMYDEMIERKNEPTEHDINENSDDGEKGSDKYEQVLELKELCEERYRVTEEEFDAWRKEFYKDIFLEIKNVNNSENPTGRELFEREKMNLLDADYEESDAKWCNEELFCDIDLDFEKCS
ncbi:RWD domain-containing protein [Plasmodium brasilianum]|uniref:RWD domain-containing protein n=1 Tax=Plasmodium brasilianum TaxID=5824 RepID=A0ACB9YE80_PLABR|nr:RWD domain-containing protein [Plasmodium brasilianum]